MLAIKPLPSVPSIIRMVMNLGPRQNFPVFDGLPACTEGNTCPKQYIRNFYKRYFIIR